MKKIRIVTLIFALLLPIIIGGVSAALSAHGMDAYETMNKPALSPPAWVFPLAWTILYLMMGLASYFIIASGADYDSKASALRFYIIQLAMNFMWSIIFFAWGFYLIAFLWLLIMWGIVFYCTYLFYDIDITAGYLMIPYILWLTFAAYLNWSVFLLNTDG